MALADYDIIEDYKPLGGGWRYVQTLRGETFRVPTHGNARTGRELVKMVTDFRISNGLPPGNVELDVADYIRRVSPISDRFNGKKAILGQIVERPFIALIYRIRAWLDDLAPRKPELVSLDEVNERAKACIGCGQNIRWKTDCGECNKTIEYLGRTVRAVADYPLDEALLGCRIHGCHLPTLVFIDQDFLPDRLETAPANCWIPKKNQDHGRHLDHIPDPQTTEPHGDVQQTGEEREQVDAPQ